MDLPFIEKSMGNNQYIREFSTDVDTHELEWHIDREDRTVEVIENIVPTLFGDVALKLTHVSKVT